MSEKVIEHPKMALNEIKAGVKEGVIKESYIYDLCDMKTERNVGFAVCLTLSTKFDYTRAILENWRKRLGADDYVLSVNRNRLRIRFDVPYSKTTQEP